MAVSDSYLAFVLEQMAGVRALVTRRMFGGVGIYSGDVFFAVIDNDTIFFKVDDELAARYRKAGMPPFAPMPGKPAMMSYYQVPPDVLEDADEMVKWAKESIVRTETRRSKGLPRRLVRRSLSEGGSLGEGGSKGPAAPKPSPKAGPKVRKVPAAPATVKDFFVALDHPLKGALRELCKVIHAASPKIAEGIKWNAPSFYVGADQYFGTANIHPRGKPGEAVLLVLHRGVAKKRGRVTVEDPQGLIEWLSPDRGAVRFQSVAEVRRQASALKAILRQWIEQL